LRVRAIPGADGAALVLLDGDRPRAIGVSAPYIHEIEDAQYMLGEGPCLSAVSDRAPQVSGSLGGELRWRRFGSQVGRLGWHSALAVPLMLPDRVVGALDAYARAKDAFGTESVRIAELFAAPAAVTVANADVLASTERVVAQLSQALTNRATIDQAIGLLMSRTGATAEEAFDRLPAMSHAEQIKVADLAQRLLEEAVRRARSHRTRSAPP
jgi:transcriptional regulator with GAF, ATPase, and Fis domain